MDKTIYCDEDGTRFGNPQEMIAEIKRLREVLSRMPQTSDGELKGRGDPVYTVFPGDRSPTLLVVMAASARTATYEYYPLVGCYSTREAALAATEAKEALIAK